MSGDPAARSFSDRVHDPDAQFPMYLRMLSFAAPIAIGAGWLALFTLHAIFSALLGPDFLLAELTALVLRLVDFLLLPLLIGTVVGLWGLRAYVAIVRRRK